MLWSSVKDYQATNLLDIYKHWIGWIVIIWRQKKLFRTPTFKICSVSIARRMLYSSLSMMATVVALCLPPLPEIAPTCVGGLKENDMAGRSSRVSSTPFKILDTEVEEIVDINPQSPFWLPLPLWLFSNCSALLLATACALIEFNTPGHISQGTLINL